MTPTTTRATRPGRSRQPLTTPRTRRACRSSRARPGSAATRRRPTTRTTDGRLQPRGQDPARSPSGGRRPQPHGAQHHAVRQRQHRGRRHDHAAPHRQQHAARVVGVRQRPVRPVSLGPRVPDRLHAAAGPVDDPEHAERVEQPNLNGVDSPQTICAVGARRRADLRPQAGPCERPHRDRKRLPDVVGGRRSTSWRAAPARRTSSCGPATRATSRYGSRAATRPRTPRRTTGSRHAP